MDNKNINLVYIASNGRSGSTLLELLLHKIKGIWTTGEISAVSWELKKSHQKCGCSERVKNCPFWKKVKGDIGDILKKKITHPFRGGYGTRKLLRKEINKIGEGISNKSSHKQFCEYNYFIFSSIKKIAEKELGNKIKYLIDSSKGPYRLWWFNNCSQFNVKTIHITKDPRGFVYSMIKNKSGVKKIWYAIRMSFRYIVENRFIKKASGEQYKHIKYEDLASYPENVIKDISRWLGVPYKKVEEKINHGVSGNAMRYNFNEVKLDEKWKKELNSFLKIIISLITYLSAKKYGYFK